MVSIGYTMMCEQRSPKELVGDAVLAERAGFDFAVISDHYHPWVEAQGHAGYAWSILGAVAQATERLPLMTYVTTPIIRYHPAIVAQKAATMALLSDGRFTLGLGAGEQLNEHVVGRGYPPVDVRHEMLSEAIEIIRRLFAGGYVTFHGQHYDVEGAKLFDRPATPPPIGVAVSGKRSCGIAGRMADLVIATEPKAELIELFGAAGGRPAPRLLGAGRGGLPDAGEGAVRVGARRLEDPGGAAEPGQLPELRRRGGQGPDRRAGAVRSERRQDRGGREGVRRRRLRPGALVQIGQTQAAFCDFFQRELTPALRAL